MLLNGNFLFKAITRPIVEPSVGEMCENTRSNALLYILSVYLVKLHGMAIMKYLMRIIMMMLVWHIPSSEIARLNKSTQSGPSSTPYMHISFSAFLKLSPKPTAAAVGLIGYS